MLFHKQCVRISLEDGNYLLTYKFLFVEEFSFNQLAIALPNYLRGKRK